MNTPVETFTPSRRCWSRPWLDASSATRSMPASASRARSRCSATGSGVVSAPARQYPGAAMPSVPRLAAGRPSRRHIWRMKSTTEVLPLVPVTAATLAGCAPKNRAASRANSRRGVSSRMTCTPAGRGPVAVPVGAIIAFAPRASASWMKARPSARAPGAAMNKYPGRTARESAVRPQTPSASRSIRLPAADIKPPFP